MSARIAPEPVSVGVTLANEYAPRIDRSTRPVEATATPADNKEGTSLGRRPNGAPELPARPPGQDPSVAPQALLDAALIASENKPVFEAVEVPVPDALDADAANNDRPYAVASKEDAPTPPASPTSTSAPVDPRDEQVTKPDGESRAQQVADPTAQGGGSDTHESSSSAA